MSVVTLEKIGDGVAVIALNRPEVRNALNTEVRRLLADHISNCAEDDKVRSIVFTGIGGTFGVGADLNEQRGRDVVGAIGAYTHQALWQSTKPVVAAVNGDAFGGGCELILQCDIIIAGQNARFAQPEVTIGIVPGGGATQRLPSVIGRSNGLYALLTGEPFGAEDAYRMGLVNEVVAEEDTQGRAIEVAKLIAAKPALAVQQIKEVVRLGRDVSFEAGIALERRSYQLMFGTDDLREGVNAALEGRAATFKHK